MQLPTNLLVYLLPASSQAGHPVSKASLPASDLDDSEATNDSPELAEQAIRLDSIPLTQPSADPTPRAASAQREDRRVSNGAKDHESEEENSAAAAAEEEEDEEEERGA
ncbi:unnamed protein product [Chrysoparadoxa australica]